MNFQCRDFLNVFGWKLFSIPALECPKLYQNLCQMYIRTPCYNIMHDDKLIFTDFFLKSRPFWSILKHSGQVEV